MAPPKRRQSRPSPKPVGAKSRRKPSAAKKKRKPAPEPLPPPGPSGPPKRKTSPKPATADGDRLQKVMATAGIGSRRECEQLILDGRVEVDGEIITELGTRVTLGVNEVRFDGHSLTPSRPRYYIVNKPVGVVSTNSDPMGRPRVIDLVPPGGHLFTVGRLDRTSEGLILVTNDGELANKLAHPRYEIPKVYLVTVAGHPTAESLRQLRKGVWIAEGQVRVAKLTIKKRARKNTILEMVLTEGRNREIRRMAAKIGHKVLELRRIALGPLRLGEMPVGSIRELDRKELKTLTALVSGKTRAASKKRPPRSAGQRRSAGNAGYRPGKTKRRYKGATPKGVATGATAAKGTSGKETSTKYSTSKGAGAAKGAARGATGSRRGAAKLVTTKKKSPSKPRGKSKKQVAGKRPRGRK